MCSVTSNYHENNKVKDFLAKFWSGLWRNLFSSKVEGLNPATLLRIELLCVSFSREFLELSEDLKAVE